MEAKYSKILKMVANSDEQYKNVIKTMLKKLTEHQKNQFAQGQEFYGKNIVFEHNYRGDYSNIYNESYLIATKPREMILLEVFNLDENWLNSLSSYNSIEDYVMLDEEEKSNNEFLRLDITEYADEDNNYEQKIYSHLAEIVKINDKYFLYITHSVRDVLEKSNVSESIYIPIDYKTLEDIANTECVLSSVDCNA